MKEQGKASAGRRVFSNNVVVGRKVLENLIIRLSGAEPDGWTADWTVEAVVSLGTHSHYLVLNSNPSSNSPQYTLPKAEINKYRVGLN